MNIEVAPYVGIFDSIKRRRSVGQMTQQQPTREQIERILEAATYAPNHYVTEPWKFFVLTGAVREDREDPGAERRPRVATGRRSRTRPSSPGITESSR